MKNRVSARLAGILGATLYTRRVSIPSEKRGLCKTEVFSYGYQKRFNYVSIPSEKRGLCKFDSTSNVGTLAKLSQSPLKNGVSASRISFGQKSTNGLAGLNPL